jgi:hypothetical protein
MDVLIRVTSYDFVDRITASKLHTAFSAAC